MIRTHRRESVSHTAEAQTIVAIHKTLCRLSTTMSLERDLRERGVIP
jgi:hypothetical protein